MAGLDTIASLAAVVSALTDLYTLGKEPFEDYLRRRRETITPNTLDGGSISFFSSYSDKEVRAIEKRLLECRKRFIAEGNGLQRRKCLCSVLADVRSGNNGLPPSTSWHQLADQLSCF